MVSTASIILMALDMVLGVGIPLFLGMYLVRKWGLPLRTFLIGCATFIVFALILESIMHRLVLGSEVGKTIQDSTLYLALYGGLAAGIFEETGRLVSMKAFLRKQYDDDGNAIMYGAGHGGVEVLFVLGFSMLGNLMIAVLSNTGNLDLLTAKMDSAQAESFSKAIVALQDIKPTTFLAAPLERVSALILHISLSVLVWIAVTRRKILLFPLAVLLHAGMDMGAVALNKGGMNVFLLEGIILLIALGCALIAYLAWKKNSLSFRRVENPGDTSPKTD